MIILNTKMNKKEELKNRKFIFVFLLVVFYFFGLKDVDSVFAAKLYFDTSQNSVQAGELLEVTLMVDTEGEVINAIEGSTSFSPNLVLKQIRSGNSLMGLWIDSPREEGDKVVFSGIIPGGYLGEIGPKWEGVHPGRIFSLLFEVKEGGEAWVQVSRESTVLLNDGKGSETYVAIEDAKIKVLEGKEANVIDWEDKENPEPFKPVIELFPDGLYYLIFVTQDKGSGIAYYDVREGEGSFVTVESPYLLENQHLDVPITVRAVDKNGNKRLALLPPQTQPAQHEKVETFPVLLVVGIIVIFCIVIFVVKLRWKKGVK